MLIVQSLAFYTKESEKVADYLLVSLLYIIYFPQLSLSQPLRIITKTLLPAFFLTTLPITLVKEFQFSQFFALVLFTGAYFYLALAIFKKGLKRYESGSLITVKL